MRSARHADWSAAMHGFVVQAVKGARHTLRSKCRCRCRHKPVQSIAPHIPSRRLTNRVLVFMLIRLASAGCLCSKMLLFIPGHRL